MESFLLEHVPAVLLGTAIVALTTGLSVAGLLLVRRGVELSKLEAHQDVAGYILAVVGVVYAVLLAFVVIAVWEQFEEAKVDAEREAVTVGLLYRDAIVLGDASGDARRAIERYADSVAGPEWERMATDHREDRRTDEALNEMWRSFAAMRPAEGAQTGFYDQAVERLHDVTELRRVRILRSGSQLPTSLWAVLLAGAVISIGFTYFFGVRSLAAQVLMVSALASTIGLVLFLILSLDLPFSGDVATEPTAMESVIEEFPHYGP